MTSTSAGGTIPVCSLNVTPNPFGQVRLDGRPRCDLAGIGKEVLNDRASLGCFFNIEECFSRHPPMLYRLVPGLRPLALPDNDLEAVVAQVKGLCRALYAIPDVGNRFIPQHIECFLHREFFAGYHLLECSAKIDPGHSIV